MDFILPIVAAGAPLLASGLIVLLGATLGEKSSALGVSALALSTFAALASLYHVVQSGPLLLTFSVSRAEPLSYTVLVDRLAAVMMVLITGVSLVIHLYSQRYMHGDQGYIRFFSLLSLLTFVLLTLVMSGHLVWLFLAWHTMTWLLASFISFHHANAAARQAGRTTLLIQGFGDVALLLAIAVLYAAFGTLDLTTLFHAIEAMPSRPTIWTGTRFELDAITSSTLLMVIAIMTKSAQFPFHSWLPGTIEAPTPVSAMLHAGIVNAGGFLVNRLAPLFGQAPTTLYVLFVVGALTALIGASTMLTQSSIKRTLAYSTMGQMGYMVMECGLGAFALAIFHLCAHGLFKATLFLNSGDHIHKARTEYRLPESRGAGDTPAFSFVPWGTGLAITLILPLLILLMAHGLVHISLFESQSSMIFLFFAWVTSAQAIFSLYRLNIVASWKISLTMLATLTFIGLTYLWAGEAFTHFLYPAPEHVAAYFQAAAWHQGLFDSIVILSALIIIGVWILLYGHAHGYRPMWPAWLGTLHTRLYVAFLGGLYIEDLLRALRPKLTPIRPASRRIPR
ncbi:NADH-quinone oxidoreductase subunit L [Nitrospira lenta]|uniref:Probable inorganic carbon transporter subunit DabB n=1 Tax=Nitrospira lenta TaxID=1436998 RepID=A0A330L3I0_9BACT|nr:proton-conducting transporter membrane subunit [Nitrospira lenta]SPP64330.1 putative NADH-quinone oxidoreductase, subunit L [Nitrospira lenta]